MTRPPRPVRRRPGAAAVEFAVVATVFFMFLFGIIEFGQLIMVKNLMDNAAREGARLAVVNTNQGSALTGMVQTEVVNRLGGMTGRFVGFNPAVNIVVSTTDSAGNPLYDSSGVPLTPQAAGFGQYIQVTITAQYQPVLPTLLNLGNAITLTGVARMNSESN
jgi:Flp pilus assembly protein TadG